MKLAHALLLSVALVGCSSKPSDDTSGQPTPRVTQTVTASPSETPTPTPDVTHYRMMTVIAGHADITFTVALNGNTIGTLNGDTNGDISPSVLPGDNAVVVSWTTAHPLKATEKATLSIERQIPGQDDWTTVYSREVDAKTTVKEAKGTFANEAIGDNTSSNGSVDGGGGGGYNTAGVPNNATGTSANGTTSGGGDSSNAGNLNNGASGANSSTGNNANTGANMTGLNTTTPGTNVSNPALPDRGPATAPPPTARGRARAWATSLLPRFPGNRPREPI